MKPFQEVLERFERTNRRHGLLARSDRILAAVSGGPDSQALLFVLAQLRRKHGWTLAAAYLDHGLSDRAGIFRRRAEALCERLGVRLHAGSANVRRLAAAQGRGLEEAGRRARYDFLHETARRLGCNRIATAHTLDDQAETVLMRVLRGSGLQGASGIPASRPLGGGKVVRPLIGCPKSLLKRLLAAERIPYAVDPSNADPVFTRNRVRGKLLPYLRRHFNPAVDEALADLGEISAEAFEYVSAAAAAAFRRCGGHTRPGVRLEIARLRRLHPALQRETLRMALEAACGSRLRFTAAHVEALRKLLTPGASPAAGCLPSGLAASVRSGRLAIDTPGKYRYNSNPNRT